MFVCYIGGGSSCGGEGTRAGECTSIRTYERTRAVAQPRSYSYTIWNESNDGITEK